MEQQRTTGLTERQLAQFIQQDQIHMREPIGDLSLLTLYLFLLQRIDQFDCR